MDIKEMISALKELKELFKMEENTSKDDRPSLSEFLDKKVLIRADKFGVNIGVISRIDDDFIYLKNSRKLWSWQCKISISLESLAVYGAHNDTRATALLKDDLAVRKDDLCGVMVLENEIYDQIQALKVSDQK